MKNETIYIGTCGCGASGQLFRTGKCAHCYIAELEGANAAERASSGIAAIAAERRRQIEVEGWDAEHDDEHANGGLALAAACYASLAAVQATTRASAEIYRDAPPPMRWPWPSRWWKPKDPRRDLVRAGALIAAEIDRLDRKK